MYSNYLYDGRFCWLQSANVCRTSVLTIKQHLFALSWKYYLRHSSTRNERHETFIGCIWKRPNLKDTHNVIHNVKCTYTCTWNYIDIHWSVVGHRCLLCVKKHCKRWQWLRNSVSFSNCIRFYLINSASTIIRHWIHKQFWMCNII